MLIPTPLFQDTTVSAASAGLNASITERHVSIQLTTGSAHVHTERNAAKIVSKMLQLDKLDLPQFLSNSPVIFCFDLIINLINHCCH
jgi:hypothetical protein